MKLHMQRSWGLAAAASILAVTVAIAQAQPLGEGWILEVETDAERFERLQSDAGGFGRAMFEVGQRFAGTHQAIVDGNLELAAHHWDTIRASIRAGIVRRPGRGANADAHMLATTWDEVRAAFESNDVAQAQQGFMQAREACMECHRAEDRAYLNEQPLFRDLRF